MSETADYIDDEPRSLMPPSLTVDQVESLESLLYVVAPVEDRQKQRFGVDIKLHGPFVSATVTNLKSNVVISFLCDVQWERLIYVEGASEDWVKNFLNDYKVVED